MGGQLARGAHGLTWDGRKDGMVRCATCTRTWEYAAGTQTGKDWRRLAAEFQPCPGSNKEVEVRRARFAAQLAANKQDHANHTLGLEPVSDRVQCRKCGKTSAAPLPAAWRKFAQTYACDIGPAQTAPKVHDLVAVGPRWVCQACGEATARDSGQAVGLMLARACVGTGTRADPAPSMETGVKHVKGPGGRGHYTFTGRSLKAGGSSFPFTRAFSSLVEANAFARKRRKGTMGSQLPDVESGGTNGDAGAGRKGGGDGNGKGKDQAGRKGQGSSDSTLAGSGQNGKTGEKGSQNEDGGRARPTTTRPGGTVAGGVTSGLACGASTEMTRAARGGPARLGSAASGVRVLASRLACSVASDMAGGGRGGATTGATRRPLRAPPSAPKTEVHRSRASTVVHGSQATKASCLEAGATSVFQEASGRPRQVGTPKWKLLLPRIEDRALLKLPCDFPACSGALL
jgi:hypothetical protein